MQHIFHPLNTFSHQNLKQRSVHWMRYQHTLVK